MADEAESMIVVHLRSIDAKLEAFENRFDRMDADHAAFREQVTHFGGLAGVASRRARQAEAKSDQALDWQENFDAEIERLEKKLPKN